MTQVFRTDRPLSRPFGSLAAFAARLFLKEDEAVLNAQSRGLAEDPPFLWVGDADQQARRYVQLKRERHLSRMTERPFSNPVKPRSLTWIS